MATLTVDVPDALVPRLVAALRHRYPDLTTETPAQTGRIGVRRLLREVLVNYEVGEAGRAGDDATTAATETARNRAVTDGGAIT